MKLILNKNQLGMAPEQLLKKAGYAYIYDRKTGHDSFVKRLGGNFYPRLHMYFSDREEKIIFDLHLDQKQASYAGAHMHNAEYDGEIIRAEIERLKELILIPSANQPSLTKNNDEDAITKIGYGDYDNKVPVKKSWWRNFFIF
jgi:hypothetical protein